MTGYDEVKLRLGGIRHLLQGWLFPQLEENITLSKSSSWPEPGPGQHAGSLPGGAPDGGAVPATRRKAAKIAVFHVCARPAGVKNLAVARPRHSPAQISRFSCLTRPHTTRFCNYLPLKAFSEIIYPELALPVVRAEGRGRKAFLVVEVAVPHRIRAEAVAYGDGLRHIRR